MLYGIVEGAAQMLHEIGSLGIIVVVRRTLVQNAVVTGLLDVCSSTCNQP